MTLSRELRSLTFAVCAAVCASTAYADDLSQGLELYQAMEYETALPRLAAARDSEALSAAQRSTAALHIGVIHLTLGDEDLARASLREALLLDRTLVVPDDFSPKVKEMVDGLRAQLPAPEPSPPPAPTSTPTTVPLAAPAATEGEESSIFSEWWFWTGAAAVTAVAAIGAGVAIYLIFFNDQTISPDPEEPCDAPSGEGCLRVKF